MFSKKTDRAHFNRKAKTSIAAHAKTSHYAVISRIFKHFDPKGQNIALLKRWMYDEKGLMMDYAGHQLKTAVIMEIFKYFADDKKYLMKMMLETDRRKSTMISKIFNRGTPIRQFFINEVPVKIEKLVNFQKMRV